MPEVVPCEQLLRIFMSLSEKEHSQNNIRNPAPCPVVLIFLPSNTDRLKAKGHGAYTQGICSHTRVAYKVCGLELRISSHLKG